MILPIQVRHNTPLCVGFRPNREGYNDDGIAPERQGVGRIFRKSRLQPRVAANARELHARDRRQICQPTEQFKSAIIGVKNGA